VKLSAHTLSFRTVLIVGVENTQHWLKEIESLDRRINLKTDASFAGTAHTKVYWIGTIGPHWRYGEWEDNGQNLTPLIGCHHTTRDQASFDDLQVLAGLVAAW
jgi:hypothetical protein